MCRHGSTTSAPRSTGRWNDATKTLTYVGEEDHPAEGKATIEWAMTIEPSRLRIEMYEGARAKRKRVMELDARRK